MKPVAIFQHDRTQGPGFLADFLDQHDIPCELIRLCDGEALPAHVRGFSGLVLLGSPASVNDTKQWIADEASLVEHALLDDIPVLGHCFGGQLLAKSMGARVSANSTPQIGWSPVHPTSQKTPWFGIQRSFRAFNWHYESFTIPRKAERVLFGSHSLNKGFACGKHLGLQCHLEVTAESIASWCAEGRAELVQHAGLTVQSEVEILRGIKSCLPELRQVAEQVYAHWTHGLRRPRLYVVPRANLGA